MAQGKLSPLPAGVPCTVLRPQNNPALQTKLAETPAIRVATTNPPLPKLNVTVQCSAAAAAAPAAAAAAVVGGGGGGGGSSDYPEEVQQRDLAIRYEFYVRPLEQLGRELIERQIIHVRDGKGPVATIDDLVNLLKAVHATRSALQDRVRDMISPQGREFSQGQREGHKEIHDLLREAMQKHFNGAIPRTLTTQDFIFVLQYLIHGATRTRPALREMAEAAYAAFHASILPIRSRL